ncbi:ribonuclease H-like protein, partial [Basidiobolus meristosporus CBS 931.73]
ITGYNIYGFDFKYVFERLSFYLEPLQNMSRLTNGSTNLVDVDWESSAYGYNTYCKVEMDGRLIVDLMLYFKRFKLEKYSLDFVSEKFLGVGKDDVHYEEIWDAFESRNPSQMSLVGKYCVKDSALVIQLFEKFNLWTDLCEMSKAMRCRIGEIYTRGEQLKVKNQTIKECINRNVVL